jgi:hypothetical protein
MHKYNSGSELAAPLMSDHPPIAPTDTTVIIRTLARPMDITVLSTLTTEYLSALALGMATIEEGITADGTASMAAIGMTGADGTEAMADTTAAGGMAEVDSTVVADGTAEASKAVTAGTAVEASTAVASREAVSMVEAAFMAAVAFTVAAGSTAEAVSIEVAEDSMVAAVGNRWR